MKLFPACLLVLALSLPAAARPSPSANQHFHQLAESFLADYLRLNPETATSLGEHRWDGRWTDYSQHGQAEYLRFVERYLAELDQIAPAALEAENQVDYDMLRHFLEGQRWSQLELNEPAWNPLVYNPGPALFALLSRDFAPLSQRLESVAERLENLPAVLRQARQRLVHPPEIHTKTAIAQNQGTIRFLRHDLQAFIDRAGAGRQRLSLAREQAVAALEEYGRWLEGELLARSDGSFRLGPARYERKLFFTLESPLRAAEIARRAEQELQATHAEMAEVAAPLYARYFPGQPLPDRRRLCKAVLDRLAENRPDNESIVPEAQKALEQATAFVAAESIVSLPEEPCKVIEMPEFNRGVAVAYCDSPGPLEKGGTTFYAIAPTPADWSPERRTSFYREYNRAMLQNLTVHEAMPGHFLQLMHANRFAAPTRIRAVLQSGTFVEGWATYAEQVMVAHGYGGPEVRMQQLKMRLRLILNALLDQRVHTGNLEREEAIAWLMRDGFQEEGEAAGKWQRACLTSAQLSTYFVGNTEVNDLVRAYRQRFPQISERELHDRVLSFGSPAPRYLFRLLGLK